ncbi:MAG: peptide-methionine (S)-S-oxide reductase MsrA [Lachnospiraceae bacterium]
MERKIYLAGGCFWGVEAYFKNIKGVVKTSVGYANGISDSAVYKELSKTLHAETVEVVFDPEIVGLSFLLDMYFQIIDPTSINKQGGDIGTQYRTGIYYCDESDVSIIQDALAELRTHFELPLAIEVEPLRHYCHAEDMHQDYLTINPTGYCHIRPSMISDAKSAVPIPEPAWRLEK